MSFSQPLQVGSVPYPGYRLRQIIARGAFGEVWEAETDNGGLLAVKFLPSRDSLATAKEIRAIQNIRQLSHPGLVRIDQVWSQPGYIAIAMELAEGSLIDLAEAYEAEMGTPIDPAEAGRYFTQVAEVLDFLNTRQHTIEGRRVAFQHCDVKPSNILLFGDSVKLCDFGLSSVTSAPLRFHQRAGTLHYAAPEVFQGRLSDWTDQYALAVTYCELRGGKLPFKDTPATFVRTYTRPAPDLSMLPRWEQPIVLRALAHAPQDRWPSCGEFMEKLAKVLV